MKILIIGKGYIGSRCAESWSDVVITNKHVQTAEDVLDLLYEHQPDVVLNAGGKTGKPNVDWCETHQLENMQGNAMLPMVIADACAEKGIYLLHVGSGCIFYGESPDPKGWKEDDFGNPTAAYSRAKYASDLVLSTLPNIGIARIRMPLDEMPTPRNLIDKLAKYTKIIDVENSITVIPDMIEVFHQLLEKRAAGVFHVTNPGILKHREVVELYKKYVDPNKTCEWISEDELVADGLAAKKRSTNKLQSFNLEKIGIKMRDVHEALEDCMRKYAEHRKKS